RSTTILKLLFPRCGNFRTWRICFISVGSCCTTGQHFDRMALDSDSLSGMGSCRTGQRKSRQYKPNSRRLLGEMQKFLTIGRDQAVGGHMSRLTIMLGIVGIVGLPLTLGGCAGALLVGALAGAAGGGYAAAQERGVNGA